MTEETPTPSSTPPVGPLDVHFDPPLWTQRLGWIMQQLRAYGARNILDMGCGEGTLLRVLAQPTNEIYDYRRLGSSDPAMIMLHPTLVAGLDIDLASLEIATGVTESYTFDESLPRYATGSPRWDPLHVELWHGGLEVPNDALKDKYDCIVSSEVVEHLPLPILDAFFPITLGYYRPSLLLLTTPNYTFNELFASPGHPPTGYPDPSGSTNRVFRHDDHQREWTVDEWKEWCEAGAKKWGYKVEISAIGKPITDDPYKRSVDTIDKATQTAVFCRVDHTREPVIPPSPSSSTAISSHTLLKSCTFPVHPSANHPLPSPEIRALIKRALQSYESPELTLAEVWRADRLNVDLACGGSMQNLLDALITSPSSNIDNANDLNEWEITEAGTDLENWLVLWKTYVPRPPSPKHEEEEEEEEEPFEEDTEEDYYWPEKSGGDASNSGGGDPGSSAIWNTAAITDEDVNTADVWGADSLPTTSAAQDWWGGGGAGSW